LHLIQANFNKNQNTKGFAYNQQTLFIVGNALAFWMIWAGIHIALNGSKEHFKH
jgi:hypothetical protein